MRYHILVCDYDGTIADHGRVKQNVLVALDQLKRSGRKLILVTGREMDDLLLIFHEINLFDRVVAENGAVLYNPAGREEKLLGERPAIQFLDALRERSIHPLSVGRVIVDTFQPNDTKVLEAIRELGLELQLIFNKGSVMVLPPGVNKATGLNTALEEMRFSRHNTVGIGDAENDHAFLDVCECSVAVADALPVIKEHADFVTGRDQGEGVIELIDRLLSSDLQELDSRLGRHHLLLGVAEDEREVRLPPYGKDILVAGTSGSGKSTFATGFLEQLTEMKYQFCIIDPEGDYGNLEKAVVLGNKQSPPVPQEVMKILDRPDQNVVVNLLGVRLEDRPPFLQTFLPHLNELRTRAGRPHWILLEEIHHLIPSSFGGSRVILDQDRPSMMMITVHPSHVSPTILSAADAIVAIGEAPEQVFLDFGQSLGQPAPRVAPRRLEPGEAMVWFRDSGEDPFIFRPISSQAIRQRHLRKYAEGTLPPERSFYFRGPGEKLNLRAQNLVIFIQLAEGVDDETWLYHLKKGDISGWFRKYIKDESLASAAEDIERMVTAPKESRKLIKKTIEERYTLPS
jgi:hydroxymethylpyrimidine pyrophosphatase-like HAD family hydrolase